MVLPCHPTRRVSVPSDREAVPAGDAIDIPPSKGHDADDATGERENAPGGTGVDERCSIAAPLFVVGLALAVVANG